MSRRWDLERRSGRCLGHDRSNAIHEAQFSEGGRVRFYRLLVPLTITQLLDCCGNGCGLSAIEEHTSYLRDDGVEEAAPAQRGNGLPEGADLDRSEPEVLA